MQKLIIGLDLGTTTAKALAMDQDENVVAKSGYEVELNTPHTGWATQSPDDYANAVDKVLADLSKKIDVQMVDGICVSGAMHSIIPVDKNNICLAQGMTWADKRGTEQLADLRKKVDVIGQQQNTGCPLRSIYHLPRLRWWAENIAELKNNGSIFFKDIHFVSMKEWIIFRLTGKWACDKGFASTTGLLNIHTKQWDKNSLELAGINENQLSKLVDCQTILEPMADAPHPFFNKPVIVGSTDGPLANLGAAGAKVGSIVMTVGTSAAIRKTLDSPKVDTNQQGWCYLIADNLWAQGGAINNGGMTAQWIANLCYKEIANEDERFKVMMNEAQQSPIGASGITMLPYLSGERTSIWDAGASASLHGLKRSHTRADIARAALESVTFCLKDVWQIALVDGNHEDKIFLTGGITNSPVWCQMIADCLGAAVNPCKAADSSAAGAARLGHWAVGNVKALENFPAQPCENPIRPNKDNNKKYEQVYERFTKIKNECYPM